MNIKKYFRAEFNPLKLITFFLIMLFIPNYFYISAEQMRQFQSLEKTILRPVYPYPISQIMIACIAMLILIIFCQKISNMSNFGFFIFSFISFSIYYYFSFSEMINEGYSPYFRDIISQVRGINGLIGFIIWGLLLYSFSCLFKPNSLSPIYFLLGGWLSMLVIVRIFPIQLQFDSIASFIIPLLIVSALNAILNDVTNLGYNLWINSGTK
jgi:hypothetical protein